MNTESAILAHQSHTPEVGPGVELSAENVMALRGIALAMLSEAEDRLAASQSRDQTMFDDVRALREMVGTYGWHEA